MRLTFDQAVAELEDLYQPIPLSDLPNVVDNGTAWLTVRYGPDWPRLVDSGSLDMAHPRHCVIAQVADMEYHAFIESTPENDLLRSRDWRRACGFARSLWDRYTWRQLTDEWRTRI